MSSDSNPPTQQSGVSGDGRDGGREQLNFRLLGIIASLNKSIVTEKRKRPYIPEQAWDEAMIEIERLLDDQYNAGLAAAEGALPTKRTVHTQATEYQHGFIAGRDEAIDVAGQQIRALRREK